MINDVYLPQDFWRDSLIIFLAIFAIILICGIVARLFFMVEDARDRDENRRSEYWWWEYSRHRDRKADLLNKFWGKQITDDEYVKQYKEIDAQLNQAYDQWIRAGRGEKV